MTEVSPPVEIINEQTLPVVKTEPESNPTKYWNNLFLVGAIITIVVMIICTIIAITKSLKKTESDILSSNISVQPAPSNIYVKPAPSNTDVLQPAPSNTDVLQPVYVQPVLLNSPAGVDYANINYVETPDAEDKARAYLNAHLPQLPRTIPPPSLPNEIAPDRYIPFVSDGGDNSYFITKPNRENTYGTISLVDHTVDCNNRPINQYNYDKFPFDPINPEYFIRYDCSSGGKLGPSIEQQTLPSDVNGGNILTLTEHPIKCAINNILTKIKFIRPTPSTIAIQYACAPNLQTNNLTCRDVSTDWSDDRGGDTNHLFKHKIKCNNDEALSKIQYINDTTRPTHYRFDYTCCN